MRKAAKHYILNLSWFLMLLSLAICGAASAQDNAQPNAEPPSGQAAGSSKTAPPNPANPPTTSPAPAQKNVNSAPVAGPVAFALHDGVSIELDADWYKITPPQTSPPAPLGPYAPPIHITDEIVAENDGQNEIVKVATSDNPLLGHDPYWLDSQVHSPSGSGMSMTDLLFYLFLPPSRSCLSHTLETYAEAARTPQTGDPATQADLEVSFACDFAKTLPDFFAAQLSSAVTYEQTESGPRAHPVVAPVQVAPMDQLEISGITFFVFEAQGMDEITADDAARFGLPRTLAGSHVDFFWAIGAESPFPFVKDATGRDVPILEVAFAGVSPGPNPNERPVFMDLLQRIRLQKK